MDIAINAIQQQGDHTKEYVILYVKADCNIGEYLLTDDTFDRTGLPSNKHRHVFFFPDMAVKAGEYLVLWTKVGKYKEGKTTDGATAHYFYWNLKEAVWNDAGDCAHLLKAPATQRQKMRVSASK